jgi:hypothetical protein
MNGFETPFTEQSAEDRGALDRLEQMLNEGLDDLKAGRMVSRDEMRREIEAMFAEHAAKHSLPKRV